MQKLSKTETENLTSFTRDLSATLYITPAALAKSIKKNPSLLAHAVTYKRLKDEPAANESDADEEPVEVIPEPS